MMPILRTFYRLQPLHDVGQSRRADHILLKPGQLNAEEFAEMRSTRSMAKESLTPHIAKLGDISFF